MSFVADNFSVLFVALAVSLMGWLYGGTQADVIASSVPWLMLFMAEVVFFFPQKHRGESTYQARTRVWKALKNDPLVWLSIAFMALLTVPFVNNGLCVSCDRELIALGHSPLPPIKFLPFCVNRAQHLNVFLWFAISLSAMIAVKHSLADRGKRMLLKLIVWNGFALAILGFVQTVSDAPGPLWQEMKNVAKAGTFFSTFGYPNMAGDYFTTLFGLSIALWRDSNLRIDQELKESRAPSEKKKYKLFWRRNLVLVTTLLFFFASISTLSRAAIMLVSVMLIICFVHSLVSITHKMHRKDRLRYGTVAVMIIGLSAFFAIISLPEDVQHEINTLNSGEVLTRVTGKGQYHVRVATQIWRDNFMFGCGGWGYKHFCIPKMTPEEIQHIQSVGGINVHNDYLQFLAEHGIVGFGMLFAMVVMLLSPVAVAWRRLAKAARFMDRKKAPPSPVQIFAMPAPVFIILTTTVATLIHAFADCPLRSPAVLSLFFVSLAALTGFLPKDQDYAAR